MRKQVYRYIGLVILVFVIVFLYFYFMRWTISGFAVTSETFDGINNFLDSYSGLPWLPLVVGVFVFLVFLVLVITIVIFIRNNSRGRVVIHARKPHPSLKSSPVQQNPVPTQQVPRRVAVQQQRPTPVSSQRPQVSVSVSSIKDYVGSQTKDPTTRIRYFLESGHIFVDRNDILSAKKMYEFVFTEYKKLAFHDEKLYQEIVSFRTRVP